MQIFSSFRNPVSSWLGINDYKRYNLEPHSFLKQSYAGIHKHDQKCQGETTHDSLNISHNALTVEVAKGKKCAHYSSRETCRFFLGPQGISQIDFDYRIDGDTKSNLFHIWSNSIMDGKKHRDS